MDSPSRPADAQRWLRFKNVATEVIPPFAIVGPQWDLHEQYDAIESTDERDFALRLGRPHAAVRRVLDASLFYVNGPHPVQPKQWGRCTQTGMMQVLIGYPDDKPPAWGDRLSIDTSPTRTSFYLIPRDGAFRFVDFDGCPRTSFKDADRKGYTFKIGWIVSASQNALLDGLIIKDSSTLAPLSSGSLLPFSGRDNPERVPFGYSRTLTHTSEMESLESRGFHRINTTGHYLFQFTARVRMLDADININIPGNLVLTCRTNRIGDTDEFYTADQAESLANARDLDEQDTDYIFRKLRLYAEDQPADTNLVDGEVIEKHRHWQLISGSTVLNLSEGELLFIYNPTPYQLEIASVSGTLLLVSGGGSGSSSAPSYLASESSTGSSSGSSETTTAFDGRVSSLESDVGSLGSDVGTLQTTVTSQGTTISSHSVTIAAAAAGVANNAGDIATNTTAIADHDTRIDSLETFETSASVTIAANTSAIATNSEDIATNTAALASHASDIGSLQTSQTAAAASIAANASDIESLAAFQTATETIFAGAIADDAYTTATGDAITIAGGIVTGFTPGPVALPGTVGTNQYFLQSNGIGGTTWAKVVHKNWNENSSGHLVPDTNNIRDIGTSSLKPRHMYLAGNAAIDGSLTVGGTNVIPYIASFALVSANNAADIDDLQASFATAIADNTYTTGGGDEITTQDGLITGFTQGTGGPTNYGSFIEGLRIDSHTDSAHDLQIGSGRCASSDGAAMITNSAAVVIAIDNASHHVDGGSVPTGDEEFYILAGMASGSFVCGFSNSNVLPSGWDCFKAIGKYRTNGSGQLRASKMRITDRRVQYQARYAQVNYTGGSTPTTATLLDMGVPGNATLELDSVIPGSLADGGFVKYHPGTLASPGTGDWHFWQYPNGGVAASSFSFIPLFEMETDSSGRVWFIANAASTKAIILPHGYIWKDN